MATQFPESIAGFRFFPIEFDKTASPLHSRQADDLRRHLAGSDVSDLLVLSHGWNNDEQEALNLYRRLLQSVAQEDAGRLDDRRLSVAGVFWPSKKFADSDVIPGGAASVGGDLPEQELRNDLAALKGFFDAPDEAETIAQLAHLVSSLEGDPSSQRRFGELTQALLGADAPADGEVNEEMPAGLLTMPGEQLIDALSSPREEETAGAAAGEGGIAAFDARDSGGPDEEGGAAFLGSVFSGIRSGARNALNLFTYYQMKSRAGLIGSTSLSSLIRSIGTDLSDLKLHFAGHSFGGRLVTACVYGDGTEPPIQARSLTLLQAAFSHNGFSVNYKPNKNGFFRGVVAPPGLPGPIVVTHTSNDLPNRWAYPMASRLARHEAAAFGGPDDVYGAIGSNGAQHTPEAQDTTLLATSSTYHFVPGLVYNLESSKFISGHGSVTGREVAHALIAAMTAS